LKKKHNYIFKIATHQNEITQIHQLNYETFVEEIPQHIKNEEKILIDRFHEQNTYLICIKNKQVVGMMAVRGERPFSLDEKIGPVETSLPIKAQKICEIRLLTVRKEYRNGRVFLGLSQLLVDYCLKRGYDAAVISGTTRELKLYNQLGFVPFAQLTGTEQAQFQPMYLHKEIFDKVLAVKMERRQIDFLPGPVSYNDQVLHAVACKPISHRSSSFLEMITNVKERLCCLTFANHVQIMAGTGTLANDMVAAQLSLLLGKGLILVNGEFGERLKDHATRMNLSFSTLEKEWGEPFTEEEITECIEPDTTWLWGVHSETSSGVLNDLNLLKKKTNERKIKLCVDCISSIGGVPVDLRDVYLATGVSGKGIGALTGLSFVFHNEPIEPSNSLPRYLDLGTYFVNNSIPFSHSSNSVNALLEALKNMSQQRFNLIRCTFETIYHTLKAEGLNIVATKENASPVIITVQLPDNLSSKSIGDIMRNQGYILHYESNYLQKRNWIQIACIGEHSEYTVEKMLNTFLDVLDYESLHTLFI